jgi:tripartite-type tricarboxylate transporter receptor subunit TctC
MESKRYRREAFGIVAALALGTLSAVAYSQAYPSKPVRLIIPFGPGSTDVLGRAYALRAALGQPLVVENVPGANGVIGLVRAAKSPPDGYTISIGASATLVVGPHTNKNIPYDPLKDFVPIALLSKVPSVVSVNATSPVKSIDELMATAKANPGKLNFATSGPGSMGHLIGEMLKASKGVDFVHVPYKGSAASMNALLAGDVQFTIGALVEPMPLIRAGRLRALAVSGKQRSPLAPNIPALAELGYPVLGPSWFGMVAPAGTPSAIVQRLAAEVQRIASLEEMQRFLGEQGAEPGNAGPEAFRELIASELARYGKVVRESGATFN